VRWLSILQYRFRLNFLHRGFADSKHLVCCHDASVGIIVTILPVLFLDHYCQLRLSINFGDLSDATHA